jgi:hypothetical protein
MHRLRPAGLWLLAAFAASATFVACDVSTQGLGPATDAAAGGGAAWCPAGLTDQASWPAKTAYTSCSRTCGPDGLGIETCGQIDLSACQAQPGCVCLQGPCVRCVNCTFVNTLSDCYMPTNASAPVLCADGVAGGAPCETPCARLLCLERDGKTGCVCNDEGRYACADWAGSAWQ